MSPLTFSLLSSCFLMSTNASVNFPRKSSILTFTYEFPQFCQKYVLLKSSDLWENVSTSLIHLFLNVFVCLPMYLTNIARKPSTYHFFMSFLIFIGIRLMKIFRVISKYLHFLLPIISNGICMSTNVSVKFSKKIFHFNILPLYFLNLPGIWYMKNFSFFRKCLHLVFHIVYNSFCMSTNLSLKSPGIFSILIFYSWISSVFSEMLYVNKSVLSENVSTFFFQVFLILFVCLPTNVYNFP